jgi:Icc-related predicted phosphoesterase
MMKQPVTLCLLGDPHGSVSSLKRHEKRIKGADIILCTGDIGRADKIRDLQFGKAKSTPASIRAAESEIITTATAYLKVLVKVAGTKPVLLVLGNVENVVPERHTKIKAVLKRFPTVQLIDYRVVTVQGIRVAGVPYFADESWATTFMPTSAPLKKRATRDTAKVTKFLAGKRYDVLLTHIPPYGVLDLVENDVVPKHWLGKRAGSKAIRKAVLATKPRLVVCGHMHENLGAEKLGKSLVMNLGEAGGSVITL